MNLWRIPKCEVTYYKSITTEAGDKKLFTIENYLNLSLEDILNETL